MTQNMIEPLNWHEVEASAAPFLRDGHAAARGAAAGAPLISRANASGGLQVVG
jgi:hypothetical protein